MSVSIIIPVYNAEQYIDECLKSILTQTYTDYEIILVDDGSKDKSPDICDDYAKKYENIRSLHELNSGPSTARNWGLQEAKGDYIIFVDSDDFWMESDNLMTLMNHPALKSPSFEVLEFNRVRYMPSSKSYVNFPKFPEFLLEPHNINQVIPELVGKGLFPMSPCTKVMKKDFLLRNNIKFIEGIISEDSPWYMDILLKAQDGLVFSNLYMYGNRSEIQTSRSTQFSEKKIKDIVWILGCDSDRVNKSNLPDNVKSALLSSLAYKYILVIVLEHEHWNQIDDKVHKEIEEFKWLLQYDVHPKVRRVNKLIKYIGWTLSMKLLSFYLNNRDKIKKYI